MLGLSLHRQLCESRERKVMPCCFCPRVKGLPRPPSAPIPPSVLAEVTAVTEGQPGTTTYIKWLMISCST